MARDLRLFYLFRLLATSYLWVPISVLFMQSRGLTFGQIMTLGGVYSAVVILVEIPTGAFADRIGRRQSMMLGALMMVAACLVVSITRSPDTSCGGVAAFGRRASARMRAMSSAITNGFGK